MQSRELRTIAGGATIVAVSLVVAFIALPFLRRWQLREVELDATRSAVTELQTLVRNRRALDSAATATENLLATRNRRVIHARSVTLAASALQSFLQDASDASRLVVTRLNVAPADDTGASSLPATLAAHTDIHGLAELLGHLERGPRVVGVERMTVQMNSALRGAPDMLQLALTLRAPVILNGAGGSAFPSASVVSATVGSVPGVTDAPWATTGSDSSATSSANGVGSDIVNGNVFSASRRAPSARFSPPTAAGNAYESPAGDGVGTASSAMYGAAGMPSSEVTTTTTDGDDVPQLYGVIDTEGAQRALLALRAGEPPRLLAVGDRHAGYRVTAIEQNRVVLAFAGGVRTLRLTRPASRDSLEQLP